MLAGSEVAAQSAAQVVGLCGELPAANHKALSGKVNLKAKETSKGPGSSAARLQVLRPAHQPSAQAVDKFGGQVFLLLPPLCAQLSRWRRRCNRAAARRRAQTAGLPALCSRPAQAVRGKVVSRPPPCGCPRPHSPPAQAGRRPRPPRPRRPPPRQCSAPA